MNNKLGVTMFKKMTIYLLFSLVAYGEEGRFFTENGHKMRTTTGFKDMPPEVFLNLINFVGEAFTEACSYYLSEKHLIHARKNKAGIIVIASSRLQSNQHRLRQSHHLSSALSKKEKAYAKFGRDLLWKHFHGQ